ncbi:hypothetical protein PG999_005064 [Apiospora kogelbergensis]|uniref:Uncharacterized protein n=2 Tax=Apiospora kogelbergensis TaxID=1337665 RepID=A0AAW0R118_9PEZI
MVARTTSTTGTTTDSSTASAQPSLHEVKAMVSEAAKLHSDNDAAAQLGELGPQDNYIISCEDSYIEAYMCWYYNNTHCYSGQLTSDAPKCLKDCQCVKWKESYWGPGNDGDRKLPIHAPTNSESSRV